MNEVMVSTVQGMGKVLQEASEREQEMIERAIEFLEQVDEFYYLDFDEVM